MKSVGIALGIVVAAVAATAVVLLRDAAPRVGSDATTRAAAEHGGRGDDASDPAAIEAAADAARTTEAGEPAAPADATDESAQFRGEGSITLAIVDAASDTPIADLPFIVYSERPHMHVFTRGVTDGKGEATIGELPEDVVIFETPRRPPYANSIFATWLSPRQRKRVEMRVGHGGTLRGRVVDDVGTPLKGIEVRVDARPGGQTLASMKAVQAVDPEAAKRFEVTSALATKTASDGRFEVDAILSRPAAIWIEQKAMSPKREDAVSLTFRTKLAYTWTSALVHEGETGDLGDLVIARARRFAGRVVDAQGRGIGGALVSARNERRQLLGDRAFEAPLAESRRRAFPDAPEGASFRFDRAPWEEGFALAQEESITAADGAFELEISAEWAHAFVAAPGGSQDHFRIPESKPGSFTEGLEFKLGVETQLVLEVTEPDGSPLTSPNDVAERKSVVAVDAVGVTSDGGEIAVRARRAGPTSFAATLACAPDQLASLIVRAADHRPAVHAFSAPPTGRPTLTFVLERKVVHAIRLRFKFAEPKDRARIGDGQLEVRALARPRPPTNSRGDRDDAEADVVGGVGFVPNQTPEVALRVPSKKRWLVELSGPFTSEGQGWGPVELGMFEPDGELHDVELPKVSEVWIAAQEQQKQEMEERERRLAQRPKPGDVLLRASDARTGEEIEGFLNLVRHAPSGETQADAFLVEWNIDYQRGHGSDGHRWIVSPGRHDVTVEAQGHRPSRRIPVSVASGESSDLGTVALEPFPEYRLRLVTAAGAPPDPPWQVTLLDRDRLEDSRRFIDAIWTPDAEGVVLLRRDLPDRALLLAWPGRAQSWFRGGGSLPALFELDRWSPDTTPELRLPRACRVTIVVDLADLGDDASDADGSVQIRLADGAAAAELPWTEANGSSVTLDQQRRWSFVAPPGRCRVRARGALFAVPESTIEIADVDAPQEIALVAQRR